MNSYWEKTEGKPTEMIKYIIHVIMAAEHWAKRVQMYNKYKGNVTPFSDVEFSKQNYTFFLRESLVVLNPFMIIWIFRQNYER